jgi:hypothetical protein
MFRMVFVGVGIGIGDLRVVLRAGFTYRCNAGTCVFDLYIAAETASERHSVGLDDGW